MNNKSHKRGVIKLDTAKRQPNIKTALTVIVGLAYPNCSDQGRPLVSYAHRIDKYGNALSKDTKIE